MRYDFIHQCALTDISSASIAEYFDASLLILGDDANLMFQTDLKGNILKKIPLQSEGLLTGIPKKEKPDWEGGTIVFIENKPFFLAVGSGSVFPQRNSGMIFSLEPNAVPMFFSLSRFYEELKKDKNIHQLNIESLFTFENKVLLINRGGLFQTNHLIIPDFFLPDAETAEITYRLVAIETPLIHKFQSGISGAVYDEVSQSLIFCASAENTNDTYNDGEIIGSILGRISDFPDKLSQSEITSEQIDCSVPIPLQKIESLTITERTDSGNLKTIAVSDNDGKNSELFEFVLYIIN